MSKPRYYLLMMFFYLSIVALVCGLLYEPLRGAYMANWGFNSVILGVLVIGILLNVRRVIVLGPEINWITIFRTGTTGLSVAESPELLKPLAKHLEGLHRDRFSLSALSLRTVLEGIRGRLDESREISRYIMSLLVFLGLLGTFWGLLGTIGAVSGIIGGFDLQEQNFELMFQSLKSGLQKPLEGMGTAFSSSLFGLGGSLVLGFLDIQANHAQNRFFNELEEWLSGVTQLVRKTVTASGGTEDEEEALPQPHPAPPGLEALIREMRRTNGNIDLLLRTTREDMAPQGGAGPEPVR